MKEGMYRVVGKAELVEQVVLIGGVPDAIDDTSSTNCLVNRFSSSVSKRWSEFTDFFENFLIKPICSYNAWHSRVRYYDIRNKFTDHFWWINTINNFVIFHVFEDRQFTAKFTAKNCVWIRFISNLTEGASLKNLFRLRRELEDIFCA